MNSVILSAPKDVGKKEYNEQVAAQLGLRIVPLSLSADESRLPARQRRENESPLEEALQELLNEPMFLQEWLCVTTSCSPPADAEARFRRLQLMIMSKENEKTLEREWFEERIAQRNDQYWQRFWLTDPKEEG